MAFFALPGVPSGLAFFPSDFFEASLSTFSIDFRGRSSRSDGGINLLVLAPNALVGP